jgi:hypothetical protein
MGQCRSVVREAAERVRVWTGLCALLAALMPSAASAQTPEPELAARKAYGAGVIAFQSGDNSKAYEQFVLADQTVASPNIKLMLGRTLIRLSRRPEAYRVLTQAVKSAGDVPKYESAVRAAREELRDLEQQLALVRVRIADPSSTTALKVDDQWIDRALWGEALAFEPGSVRIELSEPDGRHDLQQLSLSPGSSLTLDMRVPPPATAPIVAATNAVPPAAESQPSSELPASSDIDRPAAQRTPASSSHQLRPVSYIVAGVGVAGLAAFGILGTLSDKEFSRLESACPNAKSCDPGYRDNATRGQTYQTIANVSLGVGGAALVSGIVLWLVSGHDERAPEPAQALLVSPRGATWKGSF